MMKRIAWHKVLLTVALVGVLAYLGTVFIFTDSMDNKIRCKSIAVEITNGDEIKLVSVDDVRSIVKTGGIPVLDQPLNKIPIDKIQKLLESKSYIKSVYVYTTGDGALNVKIEQRKPIVRVSTGQGGFYMDETGFVFPLSNTFTPYLPIVTGELDFPFSASYKGVLPANKKADFLRSIVDFAAFLQKDEFWNAEIEQINVAKNGNIELITCTGQSVVCMGSLHGYEYKLSKLLTFYKKVLPVEGWSKYKQLDLRFSNQVVATLK